MRETKLRRLGFNKSNINIIIDKREKKRERKGLNFFFMKIRDLDLFLKYFVRADPFLKWLNPWNPALVPKNTY